MAAFLGGYFILTGGFTIIFSRYKTYFTSNRFAKSQAINLLKFGNLVRMNMLANHFAWRAGFGPGVEQMANATFSAPHKFDEWWQASQVKPTPLLVARSAWAGLMNGMEGISKIRTMRDEDRKQLSVERVKESRQEIKSLNLQWISEMVYSPSQLREKIALFWHGHFSCINLNSFYQQQLINTIREGALENFGNLLMNVSKSAAMLAFLNNQQNRKASPNENFARELLELFTLGRDTGYTEKDIKEAARAFTGWGFALDGSFVFRPHQHDNGIKNFMGKSGNFDGDDILEIILQNRQTAQFIARKMYQYLVNEQVDEQKVNWLAKLFYESGYEIKTLVEHILTADWFYAPEHIGAKIKSPIDWWVGLRRLMGFEMPNPELQLLVQRALGQVLFYPPNVAGWPGGLSWIDSSSLLLRLRMPSMLTGLQPFAIGAKANDDVDMGMMRAEERFSQRFQAAPLRLESLERMLQSVPSNQMMESMAVLLLQTKGLPPSLRHSNVDTTMPRARQIQECLVAITSLPEYQLC